MRERESRHFLKLSLWQCRALVLVALLPMLFLGYDYFNGWKIAGDYGRPLLALSMMLVYFAIIFIGPTDSELGALERKKSAEAIAKLSKKLSE
jgi:hypothetical protein